MKVSAAKPIPPPPAVHTFAMPGEERFFFRHLHAISLAVYLLVLLVARQGAGQETIWAAVQALLLVGPFFCVAFFYSGRFADRVVLDFSARKVVFHFSGDRGSIEKDFDQIREIKYQFYLTFVTDGARIMIKRPADKKKTLRLLRPAFKINPGWFVG